MVPEPEWARLARAGWRYHGQERPPFAIVPGPGQESVWDYPRPPAIEPDVREIVVRLGALEIARSRRGVRLLETASPPTFYIPPADVRTTFLQLEAVVSRCEWKGEARYEALRGCFAFYPSRVECTVDGVVVVPQPGRFYGGWITPELVGPFKGEPGSEGW